MDTMICYSPSIAQRLQLSEKKPWENFCESFKYTQIEILIFTRVLIKLYYCCHFRFTKRRVILLQPKQCSRSILSSRRMDQILLRFGGPLSWKRKSRNKSLSSQTLVFRVLLLYFFFHFKHYSLLISSGSLRRNRGSCGIRADRTRNDSIVERPPIKRVFNSRYPQRLVW